MLATKKTSQPFLTNASTYWVTLVRLGLIVLSCFVSSMSSMKWFYNPSFLSVLIRPHESLPHFEEAHAIWALASIKSSKNFSSFYPANNSIRIPPLVLAMFSPLVETESNFGLWFSILLLLIDVLISYLIEQIGIRLLGLPSSSKSLDDNNISSQRKQPSKEEDLQRKLPESVRPQYAHIFPIYIFGDNASDSTSSCSKGSSKNKESNAIRGQEPSIPLRSLPLLSAQIYYWSPFTALPTSLFYCWQNIAPLFLVASVYESICSSSSGGSLSMASFYLAVATYLEPHHVAYVIPIILLSSSFNDYNRLPSSSTTVPSKRDLKTKKPALFIIFFAVWSLLLQGISYSLVGPENYWRVLGTIYGNTWLTTSPNLSLQWYFRMQIFSRFRDYFGAIYAGIPFVLVGPLCLRFFRYPELLLAFFVMIWTIFRPVQVLYDANFAFCFFLFCPQSLARMGYAAFIALCCLLVPVILNIVDHWMWLDANNGNANYMFFQCLAYNVFLGIILGQFTSASMQRDKALRLIQESEMECDRKLLKGEVGKRLAT